MSLFMPRVWLLGYWILAAVVWVIFLIICLLHLNGRKIAMIASQANCNSFMSSSRSYSTEDLWTEDAYIPESSLPSPQFKVNTSTIQPSVRLTDSDQLNLRRPNVRTPLLDSRPEERPIILPPPSDFQTDHDAEEATFDSIIASLQSLADELEKDFDTRDPAIKSMHGYPSATSSTETHDTPRTKSTSDLTVYEKKSP